MYGIISRNEKQVFKWVDEGLSAYRIAKKLNCTTTGVIRYLNKRGIKTKHKSKRNNENLLKDKEDQVVVLRKEGMNCKQISKILNHSDTAIRRMLNKLGYKTPKYKHNVNELFFDEICDENSAYVLGLAYADGSVDACGKFTISLQESDIDILYKIKDVMQYSGHIIHRSPPKDCSHRKGVAVLNIDRKRLIDSLISKGCMPNKTMQLKFPTNDIVPKYLMCHFLRGYVDGDGSIQKGYVNIVGNLMFVTGISTLLKDMDIYHTIYQRYKDRKPENSSHQLFISRKAMAIPFLKWLYQDATIYLLRKRDLAKRYFGV